MQINCTSDNLYEGIVQFSVYKNYWSDFVEKKIRLLPNKMNKYSIRRFSVGTASILVGTTLLFELEMKPTQQKVIKHLMLMKM